MSLENSFGSVLVGSCAVALAALLAGCQPVVVGPDGAPVSSSAIRGGPSCGVQTVMSGLATPLAAAYADESLFALEASPSGDFRLLRAPLAGSAPLVLDQGNDAHLGLLARGYFSDNTEPFVADANHVYWVGGDGGLLRTPANGGATTHLFTPQNPAFDGVTAIALDDANVYWASAGTVHATSLIDGSDDILFDASPSTLGAIVRSIVVDSSNAYWIAQDEAIVKMPLSGGPAIHLLEWGPFELAPTSLVLRGDDLLVVSWGDGYTWADDMQISGKGSVLRLSTQAPSAPEVLASHLPDSTSIALGPDGVYFGGGSIVSGERYWAPVQHIGANGVVHDVDPKDVTNGMVSCDGGVCWPDATSGTVKRYVPCDSSPPR